LDADQRVWTTGGDANWLGQTNNAHDGVDAARSGEIAESQQTWLETVVTGPVAVAFWWKVDSEDGYDFLSFFVDGVEQPGKISGPTEWQYKTTGIASGSHTCRWAFANDEYVTEGANAGWVDQVQFLQPTPSIAVLGADQSVILLGSNTPSVVSGTDFGSALFLAGSVVRTFLIENSGTLDLAISTVSVSGTSAADFTVLDYPATVSPGARSNLVVRFASSGYGIRTATITVQNSDVAKSNYAFAVQGSLFLPAPRAVWAGSPSPSPPFTNWQTAAHTIQDAVDVAVPGDTVWVTNGVYATGQRVVVGTAANRVAITKAITVRSVNGPAVTLIHGNSPIGNTAVRCAYVGANATLAGFTLTNGATRAGWDLIDEHCGGGGWCEVGGTLSNCTITGNSADFCGGGVTGGTLSNCHVAGNSATLYGGGVYGCTLNTCTLSGNTVPDGCGGGASDSILNQCTVTGNSTPGAGGGVYDSILSSCQLSGNSAWNGGGASGGSLTNCTLTGNSASGGGGADGSTLNNCVLTGNTASSGGGATGGTLNNSIVSDNSADNGGGTYGSTMSNCTVTGNSAILSAGGAFAGTLNNCIIYYNTAPDGPNWLSPFWARGTLRYCCTTPGFGGTGNITNEPCLVSTSHIATNSPCAGKGSAAYVSGTDVDGEAWRSPPSIGADEVNPATVSGALSVAMQAAFTQTTAGYEVSFIALSQGNAALIVWDFGDGCRVTNQAYASHAWTSNGAYTVVLTAWNADHLGGVACTTRVSVVEQPVCYANVSNATPAYPYTNWATAATSIQAAISANPTAGRLVLVADGVYELGGTVVFGAMTNRIALTHAVTVRSLNGPKVTTIKGSGPVGPAAVRCAYVGKNSVLAGFTLTGGATSDRGWSITQECYGGGVWCADGGTVSNCTLTGNAANYGGGGAYGGTLRNCRFSDNVASQDGGGACESTLINCVLTGNSAGGAGGGVSRGTVINSILAGNSAGTGGGGAVGATLRNCTLTGNSANVRTSEGGGGGGACCSTLENCIVYFNDAVTDDNYVECSLAYCCTTPAYDYGPSNITSEPFLASTTHIAVNSPCVGGGSSATISGSDIDGEAWRTPPSIGADEPHEISATGDLSVVIDAGFTETTPGFEVPFTARIDGRVTRSAWDFGDGCGLTNRAYASHAWAATGQYAVVLTAWNADHPLGIACTTVVSVVTQPVFYVNAGNATPVFPYASWATAATSIQDAIAAGGAGGRLVLVADGVYERGGAVTFGSVTNRIALTQAVTVRSLHGPAVTIIKGNGPMGYMRCAYVGKDCTLAGFTLTHGGTSYGGAGVDQDGGGVWCEDGAMVSNCVLSGNSAFRGGSGAYGGTLTDCTLSANAAGAYGGGAYGSTLNRCTLSANAANNGGGSYHGTLNNCTLSGNSADFGGGAYRGTLTSCLLTGNSATYSGGSHWSTLNNCTVAGNSASNPVQGVGGAHLSELNNCIVYYNTSPSNTDCSACQFIYTCSPQVPMGEGNTTNPPAFQDAASGNYRLSARSPGLNAGRNQAWMFGTTDLDGNPRVRNGTVDMGAYEFAFAVELKGVLQGPYNTNAHCMAICPSSSLPFSSPYAADARRVLATPSNVVDWLLLEVQNTNGISVMSLSVFLDPLGSVRDVTGSADIPVEASDGNYYLVLKHRNHLAAMSALPVAFTNTVVSYDFTTGSDKYFGGTNACVELEPDVWGLIGGDADGDGRITPVDRIIVERQKGMTGYLQGDLNLDGTVDGED
jgi:PKD repeat protein